ncbi:MAG: hydratase [Peptococcaceae bacterium]|nr:hydratase [Peptococcaceae bacterium]
MIQLSAAGVYLLDGHTIIPDSQHVEEILQRRTGREVTRESARRGTMAHAILENHNTSQDSDLWQLRFDALASHDITHVSIIQTARASGLDKFALPYVLTNCHNSLAAVGGTINADDHAFALSAAQKYGGIYVPPHLAVIHQYMREMVAGGGMMILGSDSHTRYGALGTLGIGEGGGELVKQLLGKTYGITRPDVVAVYLDGIVNPGVGPQDVALAIIGAVFKNGYVKDKIMEFVGEGISTLSVEFRHGIDVMTAETACLSSIWCTDDKVKEYLAAHGRPKAFSHLAPGSMSYYDGLIYVDLSSIKPMIALPFHPSNVFTIEEVQANTADILHTLTKEVARLTGEELGPHWIDSCLNKGSLYVDQSVIAGCAGGMFENIAAVADIVGGKSAGTAAFALSVYPSSQPMYLSLMRSGVVEKLLSAGVVMRSAFCGPCFGAGDVPANRAFSIRHTTRNFLHREGSTPTDEQLAFVALMDARSIAATAINGGKLTAATQIDVEYTSPVYEFDSDIYAKRVYYGFAKPDASAEIRLAPNIKDWPKLPALPEHLLLKVVAVLRDPVTTTDDLLPSGEVSSYRSNPLRLAEYTLSRKDPAYVSRAKLVRSYEYARQAGHDLSEQFPELAGVLAQVRSLTGCGQVDIAAIGLGSAVYGIKIGDGSAREQAASSQRVLGGWANIAHEYATRRYRANLINWGIVPFLLQEGPTFACGDYLFIPNIRRALLAAQPEIAAYVIGPDGRELHLTLGSLTPEERQTLLKGGLINLYRHG